MEDPAKEVTIDEFRKLEVRVGTVVDISRVPKQNSPDNSHKACYWLHQQTKCYPY